VVIPGQPTNRDSRGYPGWIPTVQLTRSAPPSAVGGGNIIDAPHTGAAVRIEPLSSLPYYAGARRYLSR